MSAGQEVGEIFGDGSGPATALLRSPTVIIAAIGLWGMNVYFFRLFGIDYVRILNHDLEKERRELLARSSGAVAAGSGGGGGAGAGSGGGGGGSDEEGGGGGGGDDLGVLSKKMDSDKHSDIGDPDDVGVLEMMDDGTDGDAKGKSSPLPATLRPSNVDLTEKNGKLPFDLGTTKYRHHSNATSESPNGNANANGNGNGNADDFAPLLNSAISTSSTSTSTHLNLTPLDAAMANDITYPKLLNLSISLLLLLHLSTYFWIEIQGGSTIGAIFTFYFSVAVCASLPLRSTRWVRTSLSIIAWRSFELIHPRCSCIKMDPIRGPRPVPFVDVFYADAMCSLSKVFFDWGMLWHLAYHYPHAVPASAHTILIPSAFAALPYIIRARQCIIMHTVGRIKNDPKRYLHLVNAVKYSTSLWPICLSAYQKTVGGQQAQQLETLLILLLIINSLYSFAWDVLMDWGMMHNPTPIIQQYSSSCTGGGGNITGTLLFGTTSNTNANNNNSNNNSNNSNTDKKDCWRVCLRNKLRFGGFWSFIILVVDLFLRFFWVMRFYEAAIFPNNDSYILCTQFLEAFRRAIWNLLRVEWESIKQMTARTYTKHSSSSSNNNNNHSSSIMDEEDAIEMTVSSSSSSLGGGTTTKATTTLNNTTTTTTTTNGIKKVHHKEQQYIPKMTRN